jgi:hypothetical protein
MSATPPGSFPGYGASAANDADPPPETGSGAEPAVAPAPPTESYFQPAPPDPAQSPASYPPAYQPPGYQNSPAPQYQAPQESQPPPPYQPQQNYQPPQDYQPAQNYQPAQPYQPQESPPPQQYQAPQQFQPPQQYQPPQEFQPPQQYQPPQDYQGQQSYQAPQQFQPPQDYQAQPYQAPNSYSPPGQQTDAYQPAADALPPSGAAADSPQPTAAAYLPTGSSPYDPQPPGQYPGQPRHSTPPADNAAPYAQMYGSNPSAPGQQPYGGVPGMVLPPNYAVYMAPTHRALGVVGLVISIIGAALVVISFTALNWLSGDDGFGGTDKVTFRNLHDLVGSDAPALPRLYFNWLAYALLVVVLVLAVLGNLPTGTHALWRVLGILGGFAGVIITFYSLYNGGTTLSDIYKYGSTGFWLAMAGFFVMGVGAVVGPRRVRG